MLDAYPDATSEGRFTCQKCSKKVHWTINDMCIDCFNTAFPSPKYIKSKLG